MNGVLDHDTKGIPGAPGIVETILQKIDSCSVFVADITFVAKNDYKLFPNSNVLIELGYAIKSIGDTRIVCVMNSSFGKPKDGLTFDLAHKRWPITYHMEETTAEDSKKSVEMALIGSLRDAITDIIQYKSHRTSKAASRNNTNFDLSLHKEVFDYAKSPSGPMMNRSEAKQFADEWISDFSREDLQKFKEIFDYAKSPSGPMMNRSEAVDFARSYFKKT